MRSARNQLILLGFICQALSWDDYLLPGLSILLWVACLSWPRRPIRFSALAECGFLVGGSGAALGLGSLLGHSVHFFIGHGLTLMQAAWLLRPLDRREKVFSVLMACFQLAVACTFLFDYRFILVFIAAAVLLPKTLLELAAELFPAPAPAVPAKPSLGAYAAVLCVTAVFFLVFPRGLLGAALPYPGGRGGAEAGLLEDVLDPTGGGHAQSGRTFMQIEGDKLGYLRCVALRRFDGTRWYADPSPAWRRIDYASPARLKQCLRRRVRVMNAAFLGRVLPTDGHVVAIAGKFFRRPFQNSYGIIECESLWNTANNAYEYSIDPNPAPERLPPAFRGRYTNYPPQSARLRAWLTGVLRGTSGPFEEARRLESYLRRNFKYELGAPRLDRLRPIDDFIFNQKAGHCERFAAALALLLRMEGIPSRILLGYLPTSRNRFTGWYNIRFKDAHAWTEAYVAGRGWLRLDATPAAAVEWTGWDLRDLLDTIDLVWYSNIIAYDSGTQQYLLNVSFQELRRWPAVARRHLGLAFGAGAGVIGMLLGLILRRHWTRRPRPWRRRPKAQVLADHYYGRMLRILGRRGFCRQPQQTPLEFLATLEGQGMAPDAGLVTSLFCASRYGNAALTRGQRLEIENALARLRRGASPGRSAGRAGD
jgi:transglutaminase-like putative cysteine protease